jgi:hypothetical protein
MSKPWDHDEVLKRADALAMKLWGVKAARRFKDVGEKNDLLAKRKTGPQGPTLATFERAATAIGVTLFQLLGADDQRADDVRSKTHERNVEISAALHEARRAADAALRAVAHLEQI